MKCRNKEEKRRQQEVEMYAFQEEQRRKREEEERYVAYQEEERRKRQEKEAHLFRQAEIDRRQRRQKEKEAFQNRRMEEASRRRQQELEERRRQAEAEEASRRRQQELEERRRQAEAEETQFDKMVEDESRRIKQTRDEADFDFDNLDAVGLTAKEKMSNERYDKLLSQLENLARSGATDRMMIAAKKVLKEADDCRDYIENMREMVVAELEEDKEKEESQKEMDGVEEYLPARVMPAEEMARQPNPKRKHEHVKANVNAEDDTKPPALKDAPTVANKKQDDTLVIEQEDEVLMDGRQDVWTLFDPTSDESDVENLLDG